MINEERKQAEERQRKLQEQLERKKLHHKELTRKLMQNKAFMDWAWYYLDQAVCDQDVYTGNAATYYNCGIKAAAVGVRKALKSTDIDTYHKTEKRKLREDLDNDTE